MIIGSNSKLSQFNDIDIMANNSQLEESNKIQVPWCTYKPAPNLAWSYWSNSEKSLEKAGGFTKN